MKRLTALIVAMLLLMGGCGAQEPGRGQSSPPDSVETLEPAPSLVYTAGDGEVLITPEPSKTETPPAHNEDGSLGTLSIPAIGLSANIYETEDELEAMTRGIAHFTGTDMGNGNVGLCAHNVNPDGSKGLFLDLHKLREGDIITLKTEVGERTYTVTLSLAIESTDWSYLARTQENKITMITCITGQPTKRLCVQGTEQGGWENETDNGDSTSRGDDSNPADGLYTAG